MHHRTVKTPESAAVSLARANRSLAPPRPTPEGWARPRPTAGGQLRLARRLDNNSPDPQGIHSASPDPRGLGSAPPDGRGTPPLRPTVKARFYLIQRPLTDLVLNRYPEAGSAHLTKRTPHPHDGDYRVRQDIWVNHSNRRHALHPCREVPSGCGRAKHLTSPGVAEPEQCCGRLLSILQYCRRRPQPPNEEPDADIRRPLRSKGKPTVTTPPDPLGVGARQILSDTPPVGAGWDVPTC